MNTTRSSKFSPGITLFLEGVDTPKANALRRKLKTWGVPYEEQPHSEQPDIYIIMAAGDHWATWKTVDTRERLWSWVTWQPPPKIESVELVIECAPARELTEEDIDTLVVELLQGGDAAIQLFFQALPPESQAAFIIAIRLQRHSDAHLLDDFRDMCTSWLTRKIETLDPYMGREPEKEKHLYMWWVE